MQPRYKTKEFWEQVSDEVGCQITNTVFTPNTFSNSGEEWGAGVLIQFADSTECELQMRSGNTPKGTASVLLKYHKFQRVT